MRFKYLIPLLAVPTISYSEPDAVSQWLMREPETLFDAGIYRMNQNQQSRVAEYKNSIKEIVGYDFDGVTSSVVYDWDADLIVVDVTAYGIKKPDNYTCKKIMDSFVMFTLGAGGNEVLEMAGKNWIRINFAHAGYKAASEPPDWVAAIYKKQVLKISLIDPAATMALTCSYHVNTKTITYKQEKP